jgi:acarbose 7IV-phosphotransferase
MTIAIAGLINIETTLRIPSFPIEYTPAQYSFFGVHSGVSGVGYNLAKAIATLHRPENLRYIGLLGKDLAASTVRQQLHHDGISDTWLDNQLEHTPQSVILFDPSGRRQVNTDLKDIQDRRIDEAVFEQALPGASLAIICNLNCARPGLAVAKRHNIPIITDLHAIEHLDNPYDQEFLQHADVVFISGERLVGRETDIIAELFARFPSQTVIMGQGANGALLAQRGQPTVHVPTHTLRPVVNTVGAGDALVAGFAYATSYGYAPHAALERAVLFASWKVGANGGAVGFLTGLELERLHQTHC